MPPVVRGKQSVGAILSVNNLFYGPWEYHMQVSVQLKRIFHESFLSFSGLLEGVCVCVGLAARTTAAFSDSPDHTQPQRPVSSVISTQTLTMCI